MALDLTLMSQIKRLIIRPALTDIGLYTPDAASLVLGTWISETNLVYIAQKTNSPAVDGVARGFGQIEPFTERDLQNRFISKSPLKEGFAKFMGAGSFDGQIYWNRKYDAALTRVKYFADPVTSVPSSAGAMSAWHKRWYNTAGGAADEAANVAKFTAAIMA